MRASALALIFLLGSLLTGRPACSQPATPAPVPASAPASWPAPAQVRAKDTPDDKGESMTVEWRAAPGAVRYRIERASAGEEFTSVGVVGKVAVSFEDSPVENAKPYRYRVVALGPDGEEGVSDPSPEAQASPQWFAVSLTGVLLAVFLFAGLILFFIRRARMGLSLFIRRIAGLEAVDEAVGRATEMGRAVLYTTGLGDMSYISVIASINVLGEIAKKTAVYGTKLIVPNTDPVVFTVAREVVKNAYTEMGRPDAYDPNSIFFVTQYQMAFAAAVCGIMTREKPAAIFWLGYFSGESLILAETGTSTGAIQIAGTDMTTQLPFFVVACDYTLLGEELYAASAYLSREPLMLGALKGQDWSKFGFIILIIAVSLISLVFGVDGTWIFRTTGYWGDGKDMKVKLPLALLIFFGILGVSYRFTPHVVADTLHEYLRDTLLRIISAFALILGLGNLINHHFHRIKNKAASWRYSYVTLIGFALFSIIGLFGGVSGHGIIPTKVGSFSFDIQTTFRTILVPIQATMFALLAFFMASAAYRSFRARSLLAGVLLGAAFVVMLGQVPLGERIWHGLPLFSQWIMMVPNTAAKRGIDLGVTLGVLATSLKILTGVERNWLGGSR